MGGTRFIRGPDVRFAALMATTAERTSASGPAAVQRRRPLRWRLPEVRRPTLAVFAALTVLSFVQRPGKITFDTKLDLVLDPARFLGRALHLWNPGATFGELQNQAYGYLFPVGPYFVLTEAIGVPTWLAQRAWCALLLCAAFGGALLLARALDIGTEPARYVGAAAYALAPRIVTEIGPLSVEMLPAVLLPWVLLPLVTVDRIGSPRRAAALSAFAVLAMGGVNGAMVLMALTLPAVWLLTRRWTAEHVRLVAWWCVFVLAATLWWVLPLLLLAGYSLPFLDYVESAANTTAPLSLFQVLRGTNQWVAYVVQGEPWWPAGFVLIDNPVLMAATALVAAAGLFGLAAPGLPQRRFLLLGTLIGLLLLTIGHVGPLDSPVAEWWRRLLDGPLAAFRNVHKFDPVLRLCLALGFAHAVSVAVAAARSHWLDRAWRIGVASALVVALAAPAWLLLLRPGPGWDEVPPHWRQASQWLAEQDATSRTLMLPATGFGEYRWGRTVDEPMQALARAPWAVRNQIPLGSEGNTRFMDAVSDALASGRGSPALADFLARAGVRFLLLRNDIERTEPGRPPVAVVHQSLARSPGIEPVAVFGDLVPFDAGARLGDVDAGTAYPALEIFEVRRDQAVASVVPAAEVATVSGGPESMLQLLEQGVLDPGQPAVLAGDGEGGATGPWLLTDGLRRRERNVGRVHDNLSHTLAPTDPIRQARPVLDVLPLRGDEHQTQARYSGVLAVTASSSAGYADSLGVTDPSHLPFAAIDGDPASAWHSSTFAGPRGQWLEVQLDTPRVFDTVRIRFVRDIRVGWPVARIRIITDRGSVDHDLPVDAPAGLDEQDFPVFAGPSSTLRVEILAMRGDREDGNVGISEITIPGVAASRMLQVPTDVAAGRQPTLSFTRGPQARAACVSGQGALRCDSGLSRLGEEPAGVDRRFRLPESATYVVSGTVLPRPGPVPWRSPGGVEVSATSQLAGDPAVAPRKLFDGDPDTSWVADLPDQAPTLRLRWSGERSIERIELTRSELPVANRPLAITLTAGDQQRRVQLGEGQTSAAFEPLRTEGLDITVQSADQLPLETSRFGASAGLAELRIPALADLLGPEASTSVTVPCGSGPAIEVDGTAYDTEVSGSQSDVDGFRTLELRPCGNLVQGLNLRAGEHRVRALSSSAFVVQDLTLRPGPAPGGLGARDLDAGERSSTVLRWDATHRQVEVGAGPEAYLVVPENANAGWTATLNGQELPRRRLDGWQQAWLIPAGVAGVIQLDFGPDEDYRLGLLIGGVAALLVLVGVVVPVLRRRGPPARPVAAASWWPVAIVVVTFLLLLGGPFPVIALLGCLLLRRYWANALPAVAAGAVVIATAIAVTGRVTGHGQDWAFGPTTQAAGFVAIAAVVAAYLYPTAVADDDS